MVELNAVPVRLVGFVERQTQRRIFLVAPVQEYDVILLPESTGHHRIPVPENFLVGRRGADAVDLAYADSVQGFRS